MLPVRLSTSIDPSPLLAVTSDAAGSDTISFADRPLTPNRLMPSFFGAVTSTVMRSPLCSARTTIGATPSLLIARFSMTTSTS